MTKRHFEAFARQIREATHRTHDERLVCAWTVIHVAEEFNPRFDRGRFLRACGL